jgi:pyruvate/2-oxoglutarate/acetoin dehydrogenase E1 component
MATLTYRDAVGRALQDSLREDPRLILIGQNIAGYSLKQMADEFGESRIRDTSISESHGRYGGRRGDERVENGGDDRLRGYFVGLS